MPNIDRATLIFGGSGFIGSHLIRRLVADGHKEIISVDIRDPRETLPGVSYIRGDVRDLSGLKLPTSVGRIFNLAAVHTTPGHPTHEYYETNILGAVQITALARRLGVDKLIFTSSISVYGPSEQTKSEDTTPQPESAYGWSKWLSENVHLSWLAEDKSRRLVICRPAVIFGQGEGGNFARMAKLLRAGFFIYPGRRDTIKACFYVEDLVDSLLFAERQNQDLVLFNGCYPDRYTLEEIVDAIRLKHFPKARTFMIPRPFVSAAALALKPFSMFGLGIHPDRVTKLVRSTDIVPGWLESKGQAPKGRLESAVHRWSASTEGSFE